MYRAVVELVGQSTWSRRWEGLALMIPEGPLVCDDALGARSTSSFELCKPGDRRNVFRFSRRSPHRQEARGPVPGRFLLSGPPPPGAPPADVPTRFPDASQTARNLAGGCCAFYAGLRRSPVRTPSPPGI